MNLSLPAEPIYYFEIGPHEPRLTYHLPFDLMVAHAKSGQLSPDVIKYYPHGIEVRVSESGYEDAREEFGFSSTVKPIDVQQAFDRLIRLVSPPSTGNVSASFLDQYTASGVVIPVGYLPGIIWDRQPWSQVNMTPGINAAEMFSRVSRGY